MPRKRTHRPNGNVKGATRRVLALAGTTSNIDIAISIIAEQLMRGIDHPPTDLDALAARLNVAGFDAEEMPLSGELRRDGKQFRIAYSSHLSSSRRRFTIAHELGHAVLASTGPNYPREGEEVERICDQFAAEFLMPTSAFTTRLGADPTVSKVLELANIFKSPLLATAIRAAKIKGFSVFTIENAEVSWTYGKVRKGPFRKNEYYLQQSLALVTTRSSGDITFPLSGEKEATDGRLMWTPIANGKQSLCILRKTRSSVTTRASFRSATTDTDESR